MFGDFNEFVFSGLCMDFDVGHSLIIYVIDCWSPLFSDWFFCP